MIHAFKNNKRRAYRDMRRKLFVLCSLVVSMLLFLLSGCALLGKPTPSPAPVPPTYTPVEEVQVTPAQPTITSRPPEKPTEEPTAGVQVPAPGLPTPVPILYKMFDWGTDYQNLHPEWGPIGSIQFYVWEDVNPGRGAYHWDVIDRELAKEAVLKVTLPDGREIPKPVVIQVFAHLSSATGWKATFYDATPVWVYDVIDSQNPGDPRPIVRGRKVGHKLVGCSTEAVLPMYDSPTWRQAYFDMVRAFGERYNDHPQVTAIVINTGLDGETQPVKDWYCDWNSLLDKQATDVRYRFGQFMNESMDVYRKAFPNKHIFINNAPGGSGVRKATSDRAASYDPPIGLKHSGMWIDLDSHQGYGDFYGSWDLIRAYSMTLPIWLESPFGLGGKEHRYWSFIAGLHYHPDAIDCHPEYFPQSEPEWLRFVVDHLGVSIHDTPDVWTVLRDTEYPLVSWGKGGVSGHMGDWTFWLYRKEDAPQSATKRVWREDMPGAQDHVFSRQTRRTQQGKNHFFMSFAIDDAYPYVDQKPVDVQGGNVYYVVHVTLLNGGTDTFSLQYRNWDGGIVSQTRRKGPELGPVDDWVTVSFTVRDGYFNNNMPGDCDFRLSCERDGNEFIHMVRVEGGWGVPPTPTTVPPATKTPSAPIQPTATSPPKPTRTDPTATPGPLPTSIPGSLRFDPVEDTTLDQWASKESLNEALQLSARQGDIRAPLIRFNLASIPSGSVVKRAVLSLRVRGRTNPGHLTLSAHKVFRPWSGSQCNWQRASKNQPWAVAGCNDPLRDRSPVVVDQIVLRKNDRWYDLDLTPLVQEWVDDPAANYGLILKASGSTSVQYDFFSSDHPDAVMQPHLSCVVHKATPVLPEPSSTPAATLTPTRRPIPSDTPVPSLTPLPQPVLVIFRQGGDYDGAADTLLDAWDPDRNYERAAKLSARHGSVKVPLVRFDLQSIPDYASVKEAMLFLYPTSRSSAGALELSIAKVKRAWGPKHATWNQATATEAWAQAGARDVGADRSAKAYARGQVTAVRQWVHWDMTDLVQEWVADPDRNYGFLLLAAMAGSQGNESLQYDFASSNWSIRNYRPYLAVEYIPVRPSPTPGPGTPGYATVTATQSPTPAATLTPTATLLPSVGKHVFQQGAEGYRGCTDTYVDEWNPRTNSASTPKLIVRQGGVRSTLIRFDLEGLPVNSSIQTALLHLYVQIRSGPHALPVEIFGVARPWNIDQVTYQRASKKDPWYEEGISKLGRDLYSLPSAQGTLQVKGRWVTFDIGDLVQEWVEHPERNHGLAIKAGGAVSVQYDFASSECEPLALRPRLYVKWKAAPPIPTVTGTPPTATPISSLTPTYTNVSPTPRATLESTKVPTPTAEGKKIKLTFQQDVADYQGVSDTYLDAWRQRTNKGQHATMDIRQGNIRVGLIRYDLEGVPPDVTVTKANLNLWIAYASNSGRVSLRAYRLRRPWNEDMATWFVADTANPWDIPGAGDLDKDHSPELVGETVLSGSRKWVRIDIAPAVQYWLQRPDENYGLILLSEGSTSVEHQFASSQWEQRDQRPNLVLYGEREARLVGTEFIEELGGLQWLGLLVAALALLFLLVGRKLPAAGMRRRPPSDESGKEH